MVSAFWLGTDPPYTKIKGFFYILCFIFKVLLFTYNHLVHLEKSAVYVVRWYISSYNRYSIFLTPFISKLSFPHICNPAFVMNQYFHIFKMVDGLSILLHSVYLCSTTSVPYYTFTSHLVWQEFIQDRYKSFQLVHKEVLGIWVGIIWLYKSCWRKRHYDIKCCHPWTQ
jgi:hypothetical protein